MIYVTPVWTEVGALKEKGLMSHVSVNEEEEENYEMIDRFIHTEGKSF